MRPILLVYYSVSGYQIYCTIYCMTPNKKHLCMCVCKRRWGGEGVQENYFGPSGLSLV